MPLVTNILVLSITAYCHCKTCCGPSASGIAANGKPVTPEVTVAGPRRYKLGSSVTISGLTNKFVLNDRLAKRYDNRIDIYMSSHAAARSWGIQKRQVTIVSTTK